MYPGWVIKENNDNSKMMMMTILKSDLDEKGKLEEVT